MHVFVTKPVDRNAPIFFNVDAHVGQNAANSTEDVLLVQFLLRKNAEHLAGTSKAARIGDLINRMRKVPLTGTCDPATVDGIRAYQEGMSRVGAKGEFWTALSARPAE